MDVDVHGLIITGGVVARQHDLSGLGRDAGVHTVTVLLLDLVGLCVGSALSPAAVICFDGSNSLSRPPAVVRRRSTLQMRVRTVSSLVPWILM